MVTELISTEIISILFFVSPGFLTIALIGKFYGIAVKMEQFEKTVWSIIASVPIGITFFHINGINNIDLFLEYFLSHPLLSLCEIIIISTIIAIFVSLILKNNILYKISNVIIYRNDLSIRKDQTVWDRFMANNLTKSVTVKTRDLEYVGWLFSNSTRDEKKEIVLDKPEIVHVNEDGSTKKFPCGKQIILFEDDIKSVTVIENNGGNEVDNSKNDNDFLNKEGIKMIENEYIRAKLDGIKLIISATLATIFAIFLYSLQSGGDNIQIVYIFEIILILVLILSSWTYLHVAKEFLGEK